MTREARVEMIVVQVWLDGGLVPNAMVSLYWRRMTDAKMEQQEMLSDRNGEARFDLDPDAHTPICVMVRALDYWIAVQQPGPTVVVELDRLPKGPIGWWHQRSKINGDNPRRGKGIRIGVIDTGMANHRALRHVANLGAFHGNLRKPNDRGDEWGHGTHICGIIAARPSRRDYGFEGIAPGAEVLSVKVISREPADWNKRSQDSLQEAIEFLVHDKQVDLINISLVATTLVDAIESRIREAYDLGVICVCAAGNGGSQTVSFPAGYEAAIAVANAGQYHCAPWPDPLPEDAPPRGAIVDSLGLARTSNFGPKIDVCAPGTRIISTSWTDAASYVEMSGTSMASAVACGVLAVRLSEDPAYLAMKRDAQRSQYARNLIECCCRRLPEEFGLTGSGLVQA